MKLLEITCISMNSIDFHVFHKISAPQRWNAKRTVIPMLFQWFQCSYSCPRTPKSDFLWKYWFQTKMLGISMRFTEIWVQKQILMVLRGPWLARAGNLDIPIGIPRFLSLPGPLRSLQNRENHNVSIEIAFSHSETGFSAPGPPKSPQNVTFM